MLIAHDISQIVPYQLKADTSDPPTLFLLGYFDTLLRAHLETQFLVDTDKADLIASEFLIACVRYGLKGWENFKGAPPSEGLFEAADNIPGVGSRRRLTDDGLNVLRLEWVAELGLEIMRMNFLTKEAAKN